MNNKGFKPLKIPLIRVSVGVAQCIERCDALPEDGERSACSSHARFFLFLFLYLFFFFVPDHLVITFKVDEFIDRRPFKVSTADFSSANPASKVEWAHASRLV